jgi:hypothetical protein
VFEDAWAGEAALFRDVANEDERKRLALRDTREPMGALAHLHHRAGRRRNVGFLGRLNRVDDDKRWLHIFDRCDDTRDGGVTGEEE